MMGLTRDQRGFVLSGIALLLALPAMLLAASFLTIVEAGGEAVLLQSLSDKVVYTGHDIERMINYIQAQGLPIDNITLNELAENYRAATGLLVSLSLDDNVVNVDIKDPRNVARFSENIMLT